MVAAGDGGKDHAMYIVAVHDIHDPDKFWEIGKGFTPPEGFALHFTIASEDGRRAVCLWSAESAGAVQQLVDRATGPVADNETFAVGEGYVTEAGLPSALPR
jgi:hypothetical protein